MIKQKFRKKPVVIEAYQTDKELEIETLEGTMHASIGDWIITGVKGEPYPCKPDVFEKTYEPAVEVKDAMAIEALEQEPIIHCKDCKYWQDNNNGYPVTDCRWNKDETPDADDYCSYAERMESEEE